MPTPAAMFSQALMAALKLVSLSVTSTTGITLKKLNFHSDWPLPDGTATVKRILLWKNPTKKLKHHLQMGFILKELTVHSDWSFTDSIAASKRILLWKTPAFLASFDDSVATDLILRNLHTEHRAREARNPLLLQEWPPFSQVLMTALQLILICTIYIQNIEFRRLGTHSHFKNGRLSRKL